MAEKQEAYLTKWTENDVRDMVSRTRSNDLVNMRSMILYANIGAEPVYNSIICYKIDKLEIDGDNRSIWQKQEKTKEWELVPFAITPTGKDLKQGHLRFFYRIKDGFDTASEYNLGSLVACGLKGAITKRRGDGLSSDYNEQIVPLLAPFNLVLYEHYFETLWQGDPLPEWHMPKERPPCYMGLKRGDDTDSHEMRIQEKKDISALIGSAAGDTAIILLAYSALSIMRPLLNRYPHLKKNLTPSDYQRQFGQQIVLTVASEQNCDETCSAVEKLVSLCCGTKIDEDLLESGIHIPKYPQKKRGKAVSVAEYERALLQGHSVLWVNRVPRTQQLSAQQVLPLSLNEEFPTPEAGDFFLRVFGHFVDGIGSYAESKIYNDHYEPEKAARAEVQKLFEKLRARNDTGLNDNDHWRVAGLEKLGYCEAMLYIGCLRERATLYVDARGNADNTSGCNGGDDGCDNGGWGRGYIGDIGKEVERHTSELSEMMGSDMSDIDRAADLEQDEEDAQERELKKIERKQKTAALRKQKAEIIAICNESERAVNRLFSRSDAITRYFDNVYQAVYDKHFTDASKDLRVKASLLTTAFQIFVSVCGLHQTHVPRLVDAIKQNWVPVQVTPVERVERYLTACIKDGACARIRGAHCHLEKIKVWYNPKKARFLIPASDYVGALFSDLSPLPTKQDARKTLGELLVPKVNGRSGKLRWCEEVRVCRDGKKVSVVSVDATKLSKTFRTGDPMVNAVMTTMEIDETPYKTIS